MSRKLKSLISSRSDRNSNLFGFIYYDKQPLILIIQFYSISKITSIDLYYVLLLILDIKIRFIELVSALYNPVIYRDLIY